MPDFLAIWDSELARGDSTPEQLVDEMCDSMADAASDDEFFHRVLSLAHELDGAGRVPEAIAFYAEVRNRFGADANPSPRRATGLALALSRYGVLLKSVGRYRDAIDVLDDGVRRAGSLSDANLVAEARFSRAGARYDLGIAEQDSSEVEQAVAEYDDLARACAVPGTPGPAIVAARSLYNMGNVLGALRRDEAAGMSYTAAIEQARASATEEGDSVAAFAAVRRRLLLAIPDPPAYLTKHPVGLLANLAELEEQQRSGDASLAEGATEVAAGMRHMIAHRQAAMHESHAAASEILFQYRQGAVPYGLFLRGYDAEGSVDIAQLSAQPRHVLSYSAEASKLERRILVDLGAQVPVVALGNPLDLGIAGKHAYLLPRLYLPLDGWQGIIETLIAEAQFIVVDADRLTAGLQFEFDVIARRGQQTSTVIFLHGPEQLEADEHVHRLLREWTGMETAAAEPVTPELCGELGFHRIGFLDDVARDGLRALPAMCELLQEARELISLDAAERLERLFAEEHSVP